MIRPIDGPEHVCIVVRSLPNQPTASHRASGVVALGRAWKERLWQGASLVLGTAMSISVTCPCGAKLKAPDDLAGKDVAWARQKVEAVEGAGNRPSRSGIAAPCTGLSPLFVTPGCRPR
jgi:hypothetical protein